MRSVTRFRRVVRWPYTNSQGVHINSTKHTFHSTFGNLSKCLYSTQARPTDQSISANSQLRQLIKENPSHHSKIFKFIVANIKDDLDNELLQLVVYNLLQSGNIQATTTLLHFLSSSNFKLSNQLWSLYINDVITGSNHLGAIMVFHQLIDNHEMYTQDKLSTYTTTNPNVPFLLTPTVLEHISTIFANSKDNVRVNGVMDYFKRFYSYISHKKTYKRLLINSVEVYSLRGDSKNALESFKKLSLSFRGHRDDSYNWHHQNKLQSMSVWTNRVWRNKNIKENNTNEKFEVPASLRTPLDDKLENWAQESEVDLYNPIIETNVYTSPTTFPLPLLNGSLKTSDLEEFNKHIIKPIVKHTMTSGTMDAQYLLSFIESFHFILQIFVIRSLCELGYFNEALSLMNRLNSTSRDSPHSNYLRGENFVNLFHYFKYSDQTNLDLVYEAIELHKGVNLMTSSVYAHFFSCLIAKDSLTLQNLVSHLAVYSLLSSEQIKLDSTDLLKVRDILNTHQNYKAKYARKFSHV